MRKKFVIVLVVLFPPLIILVTLFWLLYRVAMNLLVGICWCTRGKHAILVYSDSPIWHDYIEDNFIPRIPRTSVILNWSERHTWKWYSAPVMLAQHFGGDYEFNPLVIVFRPFRWTKTFRFWQAFQDHKHGNGQRLEAMEKDMFAFVARSHTAENDQQSKI